MGEGMSFSRKGPQKSQKISDPGLTKKENRNVALLAL